MKIAVLGSRGFIGSSLLEFLSSKNYNVIPVNRDTLNLLDAHQVKFFLKDNKFDIVLNCAAIMTDNNNINDTRNNLGMFMNFYNNSQYFGKFINTGSGAEFDRDLDINFAQEKMIFERLPKDSYGFGQNVKSRLCFDKDNFYTLRIFNCFGNKEQSSRIFPKLLNSKNLFKIQNDRYFDYFGIRDLCKVVENCIENNWTIKDINCVYDTKFKISDVIKTFCQLHNVNLNIEVESVSEKNYTGNAKNLQSLGLNLNGLMFELQNY